MKPEQAWARLEPHLGPPPAVDLPRAAAAGHILAASLAATVDVPGGDVSAMDGYAYAGEVVAGTVLPVSGVIAAGDPPGFRLPPERTATIMTGAPVPAEADRVVPVERTDGGRDAVRIDAPVGAGANIRRRGEVLRDGDKILASGAPLTPGAMSLIATHGYTSIPVRRPPSVAVLTTGDEVVPPEAVPAPGQLRDSHTDFLLAAGRTLGLSFQPLGIAPDEPEALARLVRQGLSSDVLLIGGGVSMGEFDFVEDVLSQAGCELLFNQVAIQPGKPLVAARHDGGLVFGLPGNPASVMACFWLFVRPALRRLQGIANGFWHGALEGRLANELPGAKGRDRFLPAEVAFDRGVLAVSVWRSKGSHDLAAFARGSALVRIRANSPPTPAGERCEILPLVDWVGDRSPQRHDR